MQPVTQIPSPYGPLIDVFHDPQRNADPDLCYFHTLDDCMTVAGIYGEGNREACRRAVQLSSDKGSVALHIFLQNGGRKVSHEKLPEPDHSTYKTIPKAGMEIQIENWVSAIMDASDWHRRAHVLEDILLATMEASKRWNGPADMNALTVSLACQTLLTASLEHLCEDDIDCIQAAAFYALSVHDGWSSAGLNWLLPIKDTWLKDWVAEHPTYASFARSCRLFAADLPAWISGDRT